VCSFFLFCLFLRFLFFVPLVLGGEQIKEAMGFALDHAGAATEVATALRDAMADWRAPAPKLVARLFAVSDILHNSSAGVKNASIYRTRFQVRARITSKLLALDCVHTPHGFHHGFLIGARGYHVPCWWCGCRTCFRTCSRL